MLPFGEKLNARLVCNYWRTILDEFGNYEFRLELKDNTLVEYLLNSCTDLEFVQLSGVTKAMSSTYSRNKYPRIRIVFLGNQNSASVVLSFIKYGLLSAEELIIGAYAFPSVYKSQISSVLKESKWENLQRFDLIIKTEDDKMKLSRKQVTMMSCFLEFARIPHLKDFIVRLYHNSNFADYGSEFQKFCSNLYGFLNRHSGTLKYLFWQIDTALTDGFPASLIPNEIMETMRSNLKLETFAAVLTADQNALALALSSVGGSSSLKSFSVHVHNPHILSTMGYITPELLETIDQALQRNRNTLTKIYISSIALDMNLLRDCRKLKSLVIGVWNLERVTNMYAEGLRFPELKSFEIIGYDYEYDMENSNFDAWILERMPMVEKIRFTTFPSFLSVPVLKNLVNGLRRLKEITVEVDLIDLGFQGHELNTY